MFIVIGFILATVIVVGLIFFLRWFAGKENPTIFTFIPAQRHALVVTKSVRRDKARGEDKTEEQGNVVNVVHAIPGKCLDKSSTDPMDWRYLDEDGEGGFVEPRGLLYVLLGIAFIGFFRYLRLNEVKTFRWGRKDGETEYRMQAKSSLTRFPFFSGQHDIQQDHVETKAILKFNLRFNLTLEETYPVRVRLRVADPYAVLTMMVNDYVVNKMGSVDPKIFIGGETEAPDKDAQEKAKENLKRDLVEGISTIRGAVEEETGITIRKAQLPDFDFDKNTKDLLEAKTTATIRAEAALIDARNRAAQEIAVAEGDRQARILRNEGDAHRVETVIKPLAENERTVQVAGFEAYRDNETMTTLVVGQGAMPTVPVTK